MSREGHTPAPCTTYREGTAERVQLVLRHVKFNSGCVTTGGQEDTGTLDRMARQLIEKVKMTEKSAP